jgi:hypothetical protein
MVDTAGRNSKTRTNPKVRRVISSALLSRMT